MLVQTAYNKQQQKKDCWYNEKKGLYYLKGDPKVKDSGGAYKLREGMRTRNFVRWSDTHGQYINKSSAKEVIIDSEGNTDWVYSNVPVYVIVDTDAEEKVKVHKKVDEEEFAIDYRTGYRYIGENLRYLHAHYDTVNSKKQYTNFPTNLYNYSDLPADLKREVIRSGKVKKPKVPFQDELHRGINGLSVGVELETSFNLLPEKHLFNYSFFPVKDGSIGGNEFVSSVFKTNNDIANIYHFADKLSNYARVDRRTSLHIHVGGVKEKIQDEELFISALHWLYVQLQSEIMSMVPDYKTDFRTLARNNKDYCKPLREWNCRGKDKTYRYNQVFKWCNNFTAACDRYNPQTRVHRLQNEAKWNHKARYYQLNLMNWFFSDSNTIEFRIHHGTLDPDRVTNWLAITTAIVNFAIKYGEEIVYGKNKYDLMDVVRDIYSAEYAEHLIAYMNERKAFFAELNFNQDIGERTTFLDEGINRFQNTKDPRRPECVGRLEVNPLEYVNEFFTAQAART